MIYGLGIKNYQRSGGFNETLNAMSGNVFITQPWLHRISLKGIYMNSEVTSMNCFLLQEIYFEEKLKVKFINLLKQGQAAVHYHGEYNAQGAYSKIVRS